MNKQRAILVVLAIALPAVVLISCGIGAVSVPFADTWSIILHKLGATGDHAAANQHEAIVWSIRVPRILTAVFVGIMLASSGVALQGLFRNGLADPSVMGISSGAAFAASLAIVFMIGQSFDITTSFGISGLTIATFIGALIASVLIFRLSRENGKIRVSNMLLCGIAINAICAAGTGLLIYLADEKQLRTLTFWTLGSLGGANWPSLAFLATAAVISIVLVYRLQKPLNALSLGEQEAFYLGIRPERVKRIVIVAVALAVGISVAFCGIIGFVGLVIPHIIRLAGGTNHRFVIPASALAGAILVCLSDNLSRTIAAPAEVPIGIITAFVGAPVFLLLLKTRKQQLA